MEDFIDFVSNLLTIESETRFTVEEALNHPFIKLSDLFQPSKTPLENLKPIWIEREEKLRVIEEQKSSGTSTMSPKDKMKLKLMNKKVQNFVPKPENGQSNQKETNSFSFSSMNLQNPSTNISQKGCINTTIHK